MAVGIFVVGGFAPLPLQKKCAACHPCLHLAFSFWPALGQITATFRQRTLQRHAWISQFHLHIYIYIYIRKKKHMSWFCICRVLLKIQNCSIWESSPWHPMTGQLRDAALRRRRTWMPTWALRIGISRSTTSTIIFPKHQAEMATGERMTRYKKRALIISIILTLNIFKQELQLQVKR